MFPFETMFAMVEPAGNVCADADGDEDALLAELPELDPPPPPPQAMAARTRTEAKPSAMRCGRRCLSFMSSPFPATPAVLLRLSMRNDSAQEALCSLALW